LLYQLALLFYISLVVPIEFVFPKLDPSFWPNKKMTVVSMPKAAMNEYHCFSSRQYDVRFARELPP